MFNVLQLNKHFSYFQPQKWCWHFISLQTDTRVAFRQLIGLTSWHWWATNFSLLFFFFLFFFDTVSHRGKGENAISFQFKINKSPSHCFCKDYNEGTGALKEIKVLLLIQPGRYLSWLVSVYFCCAAKGSLWCHILSFKLGVRTILSQACLRQRQDKV